MKKIDITLLLIRISLALTILPHGCQLALGLFGGPGFSEAVQMFSSKGLPSPVATLVIAAEFLGSLAILLGVFTRFSAASLGVTMLGAVLMVHLKNGFFMNWYGKQAGEGFEFFIPILFMCAILAYNGAGELALDPTLKQKYQSLKK